MKSFFSAAFALALASVVAGSPLEVRQNNGGAQSSLTLQKSQVGANLAKDGTAGGDPGQAPSLTSKNNFINFCLTTKQQITNGEQKADGSCNPVIMGQIVGKTKMPSATFEFPKNFGTIDPNKSFTIRMKIKNLDTGFFVNPNTNYFAAPQQLNGQGIVKGHSHVTIQKITSLDSTAILDNTVFAFFKGFNAKAQNGVLTADVTGGLPAGVYKMCSINTAANHQPILAAVAQHGSLDTCAYFTAGGNGGNGNNGGNGGNNNNNNGGNKNNGNNGKGNDKSVKDVTVSAAPVVVSTSSAAPAAASSAAASSGNTAVGNQQKFRGGLGNIFAPAVLKKGNQFTVNNQILSTLKDALRRSCDTQHAQCIGRAGQAGAGFRAQNCDQQRQQCLTVS